MRILDILTSPWAIMPPKLREIEAIYAAHMRGPKVDWKGIRDKIEAAQTGWEQKQEAQGPKPYDLVEGVAVIDVSGVLTKQTTPCSWLFGGTSMQEIGGALREALADAAVASILLRVDSPGGTVDGTQELADLVHASRGEKRIVAYTDGTMCSAAYWIASAADEIVISGDTVHVGSIGVVATHVDQSKMDEMLGEKYTEITAGKYKLLASSHAALADEGRQYMQEMVDHLYAVFLESVARNRGIDMGKALSMADGKIFLGKQALAAGLADGVSALDGLLENMAAGGQQNSYQNQGQIFNLSPQKEEPMDLQELKTKHSAVYEEALAAGKAAAAPDIAQAAEAAKAQGAQKERERITAIRALAVPGYEKMIDAAIADGALSAGDVALQIVAAEKAARTGKLADYVSDGAAAAAVPAAAVPAVTDKGTAGDDDLPVEEQAAREYRTKKEIREEFATQESYVAYRKAAAEGRVKILHK